VFPDFRDMGDQVRVGFVKVGAHQVPSRNSSRTAAASCSSAIGTLAFIHGGLRERHEASAPPNGHRRRPHDDDARTRRHWVRRQTRRPARARLRLHGCVWQLRDRHPARDRQPSRSAMTCHSGFFCAL
jgi:hypothetical protein